MSAHKYSEAFRLLMYATSDRSEREALWNSRDGEAPEVIMSPQGAMMNRVKLPVSELYNPNYVPKVGERIIVDLTEQRARVFAAEQLDQILKDANEEDLATWFQRRYETKSEALEAIVRHYLDDFEMVPDVLVVTAGYLEALEKQRASAQASVNVTVPPELDELGRFYDRDGKRISWSVYLELLNDEAYRTIAKTDFPTLEVVTWWVGVDHGVGERYGGMLEICESMVFEKVSDRSSTIQRYENAAQALEGHVEIVTLLLEGKPLPRLPTIQERLSEIVGHVGSAALRDAAIDVASVAASSTLEELAASVNQWVREQQMRAQVDAQSGARDESEDFARSDAIHDAANILERSGLLDRASARPGSGAPNPVGPYYDRSGRVISAEHFGQLRQDPRYVEVMSTEVEPGMFIVTRWVGLDTLGRDAVRHAPGSTPLIFESMISYRDGREEFGRRYATEQDARAGHALGVERARKLAAMAKRGN